MEHYGHMHGTVFVQNLHNIRKCFSFMNNYGLTMIKSYFNLPTKPHELIFKRGFRSNSVESDLTNGVGFLVHILILLKNIQATSSVMG